MSAAIAAFKVPKVNLRNARIIFRSTILFCVLVSQSSASSLCGLETNLTVLRNKKTDLDVTVETCKFDYTDADFANFRSCMAACV